jgi:hypothetical protein
VDCRVPEVAAREYSERVLLCELKWVSGLGFDIDANYVESRTVIAHCRTASAAVEVKQQWPRHAICPNVLALAVSRALQAASILWSS